MTPTSIRHLKPALSIVRKLNSNADNVLLKSDMAPQSYDRFLIDLQVYGAYDALTIAWRDLKPEEVEKIAFALATNSTTIGRRPHRVVREKQSVDLHGLV